MTISSLRGYPGAIPVIRPHSAFRRSIADVLAGWASAVRSAVTPAWERKPQIPALRTEFMEDAAMRREMHRL
ncbi:hypothetical protein ACTXG7_14805 [Mycolicibacterium sp. Dal123E01]|uniref:hypothetical protein n=1 Tax=Mycolicibacterium sp. Dal123E01 TaxID=3457578 RepID=UPI00403E363D